MGRVDADGKRLDAGFGGGTVSYYDNPGYAVAVQPDGKILMADGDFKLMRLNGDGSFDTGFGGSGVVNTAIGVGSNVGKALVLQGDWKIVAAGYSYNANTGVNDFAVARYNPDGSRTRGSIRRAR